MTVEIYRETEGQPKAERDARELAAVIALVGKAHEVSGEFRARMESAGLCPDDIRTEEDFQAIPVLRKKDLLSLQQENGLEWFLNGGIGNVRRVYQSPGPLFDPEGREADYWGWAEAFYAAGFRAEDLVQMTFSYHLTPAGLMLEEPLQEIGCAVIPAGPGNTDVQLQLLTSLPVTGFVGMTSYLKVMGTKAHKAGIDLQKDINLRVAFVAAERLPESLRTEVQDMFGMVIRQGYGTADVGCIAYECSELSGMHASSRCKVEICDPETGKPVPMGETGEVVVTPFTETYPLVRFATGDLSRMVDTPCACGRTAPRLQGILGRVDDTAKVKGQFIYPAQVAQVLQGYSQVQAFQLVVTNQGGADRLTLRLQVDGDIDVDVVLPALQNTIKLRPVFEILEAGECLPEGCPPLVDLREYE